MTVIQNIQNETISNLLPIGLYRSVPAILAKENNDQQIPIYFFMHENVQPIAIVH